MNENKFWEWFLTLDREARQALLFAVSRDVEFAADIAFACCLAAIAEQDGGGQ